MYDVMYLFLLLSVAVKPFTSLGFEVVLVIFCFSGVFPYLKFVTLHVSVLSRSGSEIRTCDNGT